MKLITVYNKNPRDYTISVGVEVVNKIDGVELPEGASRGKGYTAFTFTSGETIVPEKMYNYIKDVAMFKELVEVGYLVVKDDHGEVDVNVNNVEDKLAQVEILKKATADQAKKIISGSKGEDGLLDLQVLAELQKTEDRKSVQNAIEKQIAKLTSVTK